MHRYQRTLKCIKQLMGTKRIWGENRWPYIFTFTYFIFCKMQLHTADTYFDIYLWNSHIILKIVLLTYQICWTPPPRKSDKSMHRHQSSCKLSKIIINRHKYAQNSAISSYISLSLKGIIWLCANPFTQTPDGFFKQCKGNQTELMQQKKSSTQAKERKCFNTALK